MTTSVAMKPVRVRAHGRSVRHLGAWTTSRRFDVRASRGSVVLDLLLPEIEPGEILADAFDMSFDLHGTSMTSK